MSQGVSFLDISADLPEEYFQNDHPIASAVLWDDEVPLEEGGNSVLEAKLYPYKDKYYALIEHWPTGGHPDCIARIGLYDTLDELEKTLKLMWPEVEID